MLVSMLFPSLTAVMLDPFPRWQTMSSERFGESWRAFSETYFVEMP